MSRLLGRIGGGESSSELPNLEARHLTAGEPTTELAPELVTLPANVAGESRISPN